MPAAFKPRHPGAVPTVPKYSPPMDKADREAGAAKAPARTGAGRKVAKCLCGSLVIWSAGLILLSLEAPQLPETLNLPLGSLNSVAVGSQGQLYVGSGTYGRANLYDSNGKFLRAVAAPGRPFRVFLNSDGRLYLGYWGLSRTLSVFNSRGEFVCKRIMTKDEHEALFIAPSPRWTKDAQGNLYEIHGFWGLGPSVTITLGKQTRTLVGQGWGAWLCQMPLPGLLYLLAGTIGLICLRRRRSAQPDVQSPKADPERPRWTNHSALDRTFHSR